MHDATKVLMGTTQSSDRTVDSKVGSLPAGTIVRLKSDGTLSKAAADGEALGISLGKDLSDTDKIAIVRRGLKVPLLLTDSFEPTVGAQVHYRRRNRYRQSGRLWSDWSQRDFCFRCSDRDSRGRH
jgi:hypothetical protein